MSDDVEATGPSTTHIHLVPHFHVDPVWWLPQGATVDAFEASDWSTSPRLPFQRSAIDILLAHLDRAAADPMYRLCVAEVDYLEPFWFHYPHVRDRVRDLADDGRLDVVGGTYNEPNTNLTTLETTRRNVLHGLRFQRGVLGAPVRCSWQLDSFGHDPGFPSVLADVGIDAVVLARGPFRAWGPLMSHGFDSPREGVARQFPSEFEWISPDGRGVFAVLLAGHYSSGYEIDACDSLDDAAAFVGRLAGALAPLAATSHVFMPIGTDLGPPARWVTDLARTTVKGAPAVTTCATPTAAVDAITAALPAPRRSPQSRDFNPVYTGKDVTNIDVKQAHRACEHALMEAEQWATLARLVTGAPYPAADIDDAWRLLVYGAHHDAITGTSSDQVYLDLLAGWRHAYALSAGVRRRALSELSDGVETGDGDSAHDSAHMVFVYNSTTGRRTDVVAVHLDAEVLTPLATTGVRLLDSRGREVPYVADDHRRDRRGLLVTASLSVVVDVDGVGRIGLRVVAAARLESWTTVTGAAETSICNESHRVTVDSEVGGCVTSWIDGDGCEVVTPGACANELAVYPEYSTHPDHGEGPWHLLPRGPATGSSSVPATVVKEVSVIGERITASAPLGGATEARRVSVLTLWRGIDRLDGRIDVHGLDGADHLVRLRWPTRVQGARPVMETAEGVVGRGFAMPDVDAAEHPWTLDSASNGWFGLSTTARIRVVGVDETIVDRAVGVAEIVVQDADHYALARPLVVALARCGVAATVTLHDDERYGSLDIDSNAPDVRFAIGTVGDNAVLERAVRRHGERAHRVVIDQLRDRGWATAWVPADRPLTELWCPGLDVRGDGDLPVLVAVADDVDGLVHSVAGLCDELAESTITVRATCAADSTLEERVDDRTVALCARGVPGSAVDIDGTLHLALQRASTAWPSGQWIDPPRRTTPDGAPFQLQHWSHRYEFALVSGSGDWRRTRVVRRALEFQRPLVAHVASAGADSGPVDRSFLALTGESIELRALHPVPGDPHGDDVLLRLSESHGRPASMPPPVELAGARRVDITGGSTYDSSLGADGLTLAPATWATFRLTSRTPSVDRVAVDPRPSHPVFSRWWAQGRGPRSSGCGPIAVQLHPPRDGPERRWLATVARVPMHVDEHSDISAVDIDLALEAPRSWTSGRALAPLRLDAGEYDVVELDLDAPPTPPPGHHVVRLTATSRVDADPALEHRAFDERIISASTRTAPFEIVRGPTDVRVPVGEAATVELTLRNATSTVAWAEIDLLTPWGSWDLIDEHRLSCCLPAAQDTTVNATIRSGDSNPAGRWWLLARVVVGASVLYSPAACLDVTRS